jgi:flagellar protein FlbD
VPASENCPVSHLALKVPISNGAPSLPLYVATTCTGRNAVIRLTRLNNQQITLNSDLIKLVESKPDTVITLINGEKILVHESEDEVRARVIEFRRTVISGLFDLGGATAATLSATNAQQVCTNMTTAEGHSRG